MVRVSQGGVSCLLVCFSLLLTSTGVSADINDAELLLECESLWNLNHGTSNSSNMFKLATTIKNCFKLTLNTDVRTGLNALKKGLPESIRNAVFLDEVCIYNKRFGEYLYSPLRRFLYDSGAQNQQTRRVFTWTPGAWEHHNKGDWRLVPSSDNAFFIVAANNGEHLGVTDVVKEQRRRVVTSTLRGQHFDEDPAVWVLEATGDDVYIRNQEVGEYLYAVDGMNYDSERRAVNTWTGRFTGDNGCHGDQQCIWTIKPC